MPEQPGPSWKPTDRDLARLMRRAEREVADDPTATELHERLRQRENMESDREHRARSDHSAILGARVGLVLLLVFVIGSLVLPHR
ncbi:hypothetical protein [Streptomyces griseofuscus]|uniref:hypothetical protein n=1 Tax=Streptomyces griseofuscus TaxID=146922 RepID=UPI0038106A21